MSQTAPTVTIRPMAEADVVRVHALAQRAFGDLDRRKPPTHDHPVAGPDDSRSHFRYEHLIRSDAGGCWVAEDGESGTPVGAVAALVRDGVWGLSLLVVEPTHQSAGLGAALLRRALDHGRDARAGIILASSDVRALRVYALAGFGLHPTWSFVGRPDRDAIAHLADGVRTPRAPSAADRDVVDRVSRRVRGASYAGELDVWRELGADIALYADRGFAVAGRGLLRTICASDDAAAQALLAWAILGTPPDKAASVEWVTSAQQHWVLPVALAARLEAHTGGAVCLRGDFGGARLTPWIPGGAFL